MEMAPNLAGMFSDVHFPENQRHPERGRWRSEGHQKGASRCPGLPLGAFPVCSALFQFQSSHLTIMSSFLKVV